MSLTAADGSNSVSFQRGAPDPAEQAHWKQSWRRAIYVYRRSTGSLLIKTAQYKNWVGKGGFSALGENAGDDGGWLASRSRRDITPIAACR